MLVSPLTTLQAKGLTSDQIAKIFNKIAQNENISDFNASAASILEDPLKMDSKTKR